MDDSGAPVFAGGCRALTAVGFLFSFESSEIILQGGAKLLCGLRLISPRAGPVSESLPPDWLVEPSAPIGP